MNLISALCNLVQCDLFRLDDIRKSVPNSVSSSGEPLEIFVRSIFCGIPGKPNTFVDVKRVFSYLGGSNNPPDAMLRNGGDAIEIKKVEREMGQIVLNSSLPKTRIHSDDKMITQKARKCEKWEVRDLLYVVGVVPHSDLRTLFFFYGDCFARQEPFYDLIFDSIKSRIGEIGGVSSDSNEYGFLTDVDRLGNGVRMRIRPINSFDSPWKLFKNHVSPTKKPCFDLVAIMRKVKYDSFPDESKKMLEGMGVAIREIDLRNPDDPENTVKAILIRLR